MRMGNTLRFGPMDASGNHGPAASAALAVVVVPVKAFGRAKGRLADVLDGPSRAALARAMADRVVAAAAPLGVTVVCDDDEVAEWARGAGAAVVWTPGLGLNGAVARAVERLAGAGVGRAVVAHADLPFAAGLADFADAADDEVVVVPDRRRDGTNVLSLPTTAGFGFGYGAGSFERHRSEAARVGLRLRVVEAEHLGWDVDEPADLDVPAHLGSLPGRDDR
jgi:2-phospho-L-lactate guanylyltransferase